MSRCTGCGIACVCNAIDPGACAMRRNESGGRQWPGRGPCCNCHFFADAEEGEHGRHSFEQFACGHCKARRASWDGATTAERYNAAHVSQGDHLGLWHDDGDHRANAALEGQANNEGVPMPPQPTPSPYAAQHPSKECVLCLAAPRSVRLVPCGHACLCFKCFTQIMASQHGQCPLCRAQMLGHCKALISEKTWCDVSGLLAGDAASEGLQVHMCERITRGPTINYYEIAMQRGQEEGIHRYGREMVPAKRSRCCVS